MSDAPIIITRDLRRSYQSGGAVLHALDGVSIEVRPGEMLCVLGRSGSGKSTLMNILGGLDRPTSGTAIVAGHDLSRLSASALSRFRGTAVGFVFQSFQLMPRYKAWENVALPLVFSGASAGERKRAAEPLLEKVGLSGRADHSPSELSGGEQQRVAVARALVTNPRLLLCDEPTGNLDSANADRVMDVLCEVYGQGTTVVIVTHDEALAQRYATRVLRMADGKVVADERVRELAGV